MSTGLRKPPSDDPPCAEVCEDDSACTFIDAGQPRDGRLIGANQARRETLPDWRGAAAAAPTRAS